MTTDTDPDQIIARVLERYMTREASLELTGMARRVLIVDENVSQLIPALKEANFRVKTPPKGMSDKDIIKNLLEHQILVTRNTKDFLTDAPAYEYGIIGLEALPFIDPAPDFETNQTVRLLSQAFAAHKLTSNRSSFVLMLHPSGRHVFERLE